MALTERARPSLVAVLTLGLLALTGAVAEAGNTRYVQVTGTATASGTATISIETFNKPDFTGPRSGGGGGASPNANYVVTLTINDGTGKLDVASMLADSLNAQLPADFNAFVHGSFANVVQVDYTPVGSFEFTSIVENIPGIWIYEVESGAIPTLAEWGVISLTLLLVAMGVVMIRRRTGGDPTPA
jgi:hypothetical protein